jgi:hypothetical protein
MAFTAALCKLQNVTVISSPPNGGLMEKLPSQVMCLFGSNALFPLQQQNLTPLTASRGLAGLGGDA